MPRKHNAICDREQLWNRHEKLYESVFYKALCLMEITDVENRNEDSISEELNLKLRAVCFNNNYHLNLPVWEGPIPPTTNNQLKGGSKGKRPDFSCTIVNPFASSLEDYDISLHIECKRLGIMKGSWNLNKNYVMNGVRRFDSSNHKYGQNASSGIMIGYITSSKRTIILNEVNNHLKHQFPQLSFNFFSKVEICSIKLARRNVTPCNFKLIHIWADLRGN